MFNFEMTINSLSFLGTLIRSIAHTVMVYFLNFNYVSLGFLCKFVVMLNGMSYLGDAVVLSEMKHYVLVGVFNFDLLQTSFTFSDSGISIQI